MGVPKQVQMYVDSREKVTARYQVISRSEQNDLSVSYLFLLCQTIVYTDCSSFGLCNV